jgi:DNA mismatch endonuclease (patch repair protein)
VAETCVPKTNAGFWRNTIKSNRARTRDRLVTRTLRARGWRVLRIWEHELKRKTTVPLVRRLLLHLGRSA